MMRFLSVYFLALPMVLTFGIAHEVYSQPQMGICKPVAQRDRELGCWILTNKSLGELPKARLFWHLDKFDTLESAKGAEGPSSTVVQAVGVVWLFTIEAETWRPSGGERVAQI